MKRIFDAYVLWPFGKKFIFELVMCVRTRDFTVFRLDFKETYLVIIRKSKIYLPGFLFHPKIMFRQTLLLWFVWLSNFTFLLWVFNLKLHQCVLLLQWSRSFCKVITAFNELVFPVYDALLSFDPLIFFYSHQDISASHD